jgi:hypothetical protein
MAVFDTKARRFLRALMCVGVALIVGSLIIFWGRPPVPHWAPLALALFGALLILVFLVVYCLGVVVKSSAS